MKLYYKEVSGSILDIKIDKRNECFNFGLDNAHPSLIDALIEMSPTAKTCVDRGTKAIYGGSFGESGEIVVNSDGETLNEVFRVSARQYEKQGNAFLQITFNAFYEVSSIRALKVRDVRKGKSDDRGYSGKFIVYDNWDKSKSKKIQSSNFKIAHTVNYDKEVIKRQVEKAGGIESHRGQIIHIKKDILSVYSLSSFDSVKHNMLLEAESQVFRSKGVSEGFLSTKLMTVQPFADDDTRKDFKKDLNSLRGAKKTSSVLVLETSQPSDDVSKQIGLQDLAGEYNDRMFEYSDKIAESDICKVATIPVILVNNTDNSVFGSSGEQLKEAKMQVWESREEDRLLFERTFSRILKNWKNETALPLKVVNPYEEKTEQTV